MGNSVIYRPAYDAEVEYLESTGTQFIDTQVKGYMNHTYVIDFNQVDTGNYRIWGVFGQSAYRGYNMSITWVDSNTWGLRWDSTIDGEQFVGLINKDTDRHTIKIQNGVVYVDEVNKGTSTGHSSSTVINYNVFLFTANPADNTPSTNAKMRLYSYKNYDEDNNLVRDMIPVRIGSVGYMYDKVSKQLFANKGTGNFILGSNVSNAVIPQQRCVLYFGNQRSVGFERIYEEYEWLYGNGVPYINTLLRIEDFKAVDLLLKIKDIQQLSSIRYILSAGGVQSYNGFNISTRNVNNKLRICDGYNSVKNLGSADGVHTLELRQGSAYYDDIQMTSSYLATSATTLGLFACPAFSSRAIGYVARLKINGIIDLVPCKLLQSIPAILDANGIARQAGECGMWDKVSNRFYGNRGNSGSFTVKGAKCYEEYKWLVGGGVINTQLTSLSVVEYKIDTSISSSVSTIFYSNAANEFAIQHQIIDVSIFSNSTPNPLQFTTHLREYTMQIDFQNGTVKVVETNQSGNKSLPTSFNYPLKISAGVAKLKYFKLGTDMHLVPCKLIQGIPASMDANGIARPAGTCGMWDKKNDKFYGNVGSGSFTVSNI